MIYIASDHRVETRKNFTHADSDIGRRRDSDLLHFYALVDSETEGAAER